VASKILLPFSLLALALPAVVPAQTVSETYAKLCAGCHGADAHGTQQGPGLAGNLRVSRRSMSSLRNIISKGVPAAGMPAFDLPEETVDALAKLVISLNASAADSDVPGDPAAGRRLFFGQAGCASCHMVAGAGKAVGPDLSGIARERTVDQLRDSLLQPQAEIAEGYSMVRVRLRDGAALRGFARNRTAFDLAVQDLDGRLHPLSLDDVAEIAEEVSTPMPATQASPEELQNLLAYLSGLRGVTPDVAAVPGAPSPDGVDFSRILNPLPATGSPTAATSAATATAPHQINTPTSPSSRCSGPSPSPCGGSSCRTPRTSTKTCATSASKPCPSSSTASCTSPAPTRPSRSTPAPAPRSGITQRPRTPGLVSDPSLGTNRGVAILGDKVFIVTDNAHLIALHRTTGSLVWETMPEEKQRYGGTVAPLIVKDMVIAGVAGGDWGIRGFIWPPTNADTGERVWRHWTVPAEGEPGIETWEGPGYKLGGGSTWLTGSYDPDTDTLYWATGNPWPNSDDSERGGDNLFTDSVLALDPATGKLKWYYQFTPHDTHDWDATVPNVLIDATYTAPAPQAAPARRPQRLLLRLRPHRRRAAAGKCPSRARSPGPAASARRTPACPEPNRTELPRPRHQLERHGLQRPTRALLHDGHRKVPRESVARKLEVRAPPVDPGQKYLRALNIETGEIAWEVPQVGPVDGKRVAGIFGTAGGLLFYGDPSGYFLAADERDGKTLWRLPLNATIKTSPVTYSVDGRQMVTLAVGSTIMTFGLPE
jgi:putative heme-binding domain-containing protein